MEDLKEAAGPRRSPLRILLYLLAGATALAVVIGVAAWRQAPPRVAIDAATAIDSIMAETYGRYSAERKGWLHVGADKVTYLMRVVQQAHVADGADGDELYFVASGAAMDGSENALYGVFHVHPTRPYDGNLTQASLQVRHESRRAVGPEQVRFAALDGNLRGWIVEATTGTDPAQAPVTATNTILAPRGDEIAVLGEFLAARASQPALPCAQAKATWDDWSRAAAADAQDAQGSADDDTEEEEEPPRCEQRRWNYHLPAAGAAAMPVPITVTAAGTLDGQPVEAHAWTLVFDPQRAVYGIPEELKDE
jgi:hypothetical protein